MLTIFLSGPTVAAAGEWVDLNSQAVRLYRAGLCAQALPIAQEALALAESTCGAGHPYVATSLNNLAALYQSLGRFQEAEPLYRRALAIDRELFGEEDPRVEVSRHNLRQLQDDMEPQPPAVLPPTAGEFSPRQPADPWEEEQEPDRRFRFLGWEAEGAVRGGWRSDDLRWNIAGNIGGQSPNILSELTWDDVESTTVSGYGLLTWKPWVALRGSGGYGWIYRGANQDSDYLGDNRTFEFSRSNNASDDGHVLDLALGAGYPWTPFPEAYDFRFIPMGGYSYHEQSFAITDGFQTIPATGYFNDLNSGYKAEWRGPWVGFDTDFKPYDRVRFTGGFEYHWASYLANARWNLRDDFSQPKSFRHTADGRGLVGTAGLAWRISDRWLIQGDAEFQSWSTDPGIDRTFFSNGTTAETRLNEVQWDSYAFSLGARCRF